MFSALRKFFGKRVDDQIDSPQEIASSPEFTSARPAGAVPVPRPEAQSRVRVELPARPAAAGPAVATNNSSIALPLRSVIGRLPNDLMARIRQMDVGEAEVFIPLQKVLVQLSQGAVRISFGELRQASPPGTFSAENDRDRVLVDLPLHEILVRVNPAMMARRPVQKHVEVPPEVAGPFGGQSQVTISSAPLKPAPRQPDEEPLFKRSNAPASPATPPIYSPIAPAPLPPNKPVQLPGAPAFNRVNGPATPPKPVFAPDESIFKRATPSAPAPTPIPEQPVFKRASAPAPEPEALPEEPIFRRMPATPAPAPISQVTPISPVPEPPMPAIPFGGPIAVPTPVALRNLTPPPLSMPAPVALPTPPEEPEPIRFNPSFTPQTPAPTPPPTPRAQPSRETVFLTLSLFDLSQTWPEPVRQEITTLDLRGATAALPQGMIEAAIKQGKVVFPWKVVRSWIRPPVPPSHVSPHDAMPLELPMKVVTPAFLASLRGSRPQKKVSLDANIPDLFSGAAGTETAAVSPAAPPPTPSPILVAAPVSAPVVTPSPSSPDSTDTNYYVWKDKADAVEEEPAPVVKKGPTPGTSFLQRYATPNEIVSKAAALNGVGGALIALPDGLLVASKIPADMNADTLAAFLPQIFGRVSQSTRELRMGDLNNLNFTVGLVPWKIFRVGAIYFAAFGIPGQPLPTAQLAGIAAELDRKAK